MATGWEISTIAWSVHEAITVLNRPLNAREITEFLTRVWNQNLVQSEVDQAVVELIARGKLRVAYNDQIDDFFDTFARNAEGKRCSPRDRDMNPASPNYGWF